jgi:hypothetical protein
VAASLVRLESRSLPCKGMAAGLIPGRADILRNRKASFSERLPFSYPIFLLSRFWDDTTSAVTVPSTVLVTGFTLRSVASYSPHITLTQPEWSREKPSARDCSDGPRILKFLSRKTERSHKTEVPVPEDRKVPEY